MVVEQAPKQQAIPHNFTKSVSTTRLKAIINIQHTEFAYF
jgi:hypothetical protein